MGKEQELNDYGRVLDKNEIKSEVENTLTTDCFLNAFSCAQIGKSSFNANTKYHINPFSLSSSSMPSFILSPSSIASSSVNLLFADNDSNMNLCNSFDFFNSCSKIEYINNLSAKNRKAFITLLYNSMKKGEKNEKKKSNLDDFCISGVI